MFVHSIIILSRSQQFPTSSSQNQVELGKWATGHFMHWLFSRRCFQMHFPEWKCVYFNYDFTEVCFWWSDLQYTTNGSDNGFALVRRQAIIWTNDGLVYWCTFVSLGLSELSHSIGSPFSDIYSKTLWRVAPKQFAHNWHLPYCQYTHVSFI